MGPYEYDPMDYSSGNGFVGPEKPGNDFLSILSGFGGNGGITSLASTALSGLPAIEEEKDVLDVATDIGTTALDMAIPGAGTALNVLGQGIDAIQANTVEKDEYGILKPHNKGLLNLRGKKADTLRYNKEYMDADNANTRNEDYKRTQQLYMLAGGKVKISNK